LFCVSFTTEKTKPKLLWCCYFDQMSRRVLEREVPRNVHLVSDPDSTIDVEAMLNEAERIYHKICPDREFIPQVPHPEDGDVVFVCFDLYSPRFIYPFIRFNLSFLFIAQSAK
jgi:hypothetical protein